MYATKKELELLGPTDKAGDVRRALGILTDAEKERLAYIRRVRQLGEKILKDQTFLAERPGWLGFEDYRRLLKVQEKHLKFRNYKKKS